MKTTYRIKNKLWKKVRIFLFFSPLLTLISCDSFVEVDLPKSQLTNVSVFQNYPTANAAMADVYAKIRDRGLLTGTVSGLSNQLGNYADELTFYSASNFAALEYYTNTILPSNTSISTMWNNTYNQIYAANAVLEGVEGAAFSIQQKQGLQGEALFVRALLHFYLLQLFGDVPYLKTTDYLANSKVTRLSSEQVYTNLIDDLKKATVLLPAAYGSSERVRPNAFAAKALLARAYLYHGDWADAVKMSSEVIANNSLYGFENDLNKVFLKTSTEAIWQFIPTVAGKNTDEAILFTFTSGPPPLVALSESLMNSFASNDLRKSAWSTAITNGSKSWSYVSKYKEPKNTTTSREYSIVLRLTEQYMIRAEAKAQAGDMLAAKEDLDKIRKRAGLSGSTAGSKDDLLEAIIEERRKELFAEYGHRFFDLKRTGLLEDVLSVKPGWNATDRLLPIPESELTLNPNLRPQNPGY